MPILGRLLLFSIRILGIICIFAPKLHEYMEYFKRHIDEKLREWKEDPRRKPLLIRGARQVGKSTAVREIGVSVV